MTDPFSWTIDLGRWSSTRVRIHLLLALFLVLELLEAAISPRVDLAPTACWLGLLLLALAIHECGHAAMAVRLGQDPEDLRLWPLGNLVLPAPSYLQRPQESFLIAMAGPLLSGTIALAAAVGLQIGGARMMLSPFGNTDYGSGVPWIGDKPAPDFSAAWFVGWFGWLNLVLCLANLIPALPMDGGRMVRAVLSGTSEQPRDTIAASYIARAFAFLLALVGLVRLFQGRPGAIPLIGLALLIELIVRYEARMFEEGGLYDDASLFGYDFSEGYTSLEASATVRPRRESALRRWRRRRSEVRRQRRLAREAAQEQRMDEILEKLHREGRTALTDDEYRFLVRVSRKIKNRPRMPED